MTVSVIIPIGPGHEQLAEIATHSVNHAWITSKGPFRRINIVQQSDTEGRLGRSGARNLAMDKNPADWFFLLDADDKMYPNAFQLIDLTVAATFGAIYLNGKRYRKNQHPVTRATLFRMGAVGTLTMGCFVRGNLGLRFDETLDIGEDFDFYMRLPDFVKRTEPLVSIGYDQPSAGGPRGYQKCDWLAACRTAIDRYR